MDWADQKGILELPYSYAKCGLVLKLLTSVLSDAQSVPSVSHRVPNDTQRVPSDAQRVPSDGHKVPKWARPVGHSQLDGAFYVFNSRNQSSNYRHASHPSKPAGPVINFRGARSNYGSNVPRHVKSANRKNG